MSGFGLAAGAGDAALRVDDEVADEPGTGQGGERQEGRRRVAARRADERDRRVDEGRELGSMELRKAVDGDVEQLGRGVLEAVPARIVGGVAQPEVRPEVDDRGAGGEQVRDEPGRRAVGEGQERRVDVGQVGPHGQVGRGEVGVVVADRLVLAVAPGEPDDLHVRMPAQQPDQLAAAIAGRADDPDPDPPRRRRSAGTPRAERGRIPDGRSVAIAAGDPSPALTGARGLSRKADSDGSPGSDGPSSWAYDDTALLHNDASVPVRRDIRSKLSRSSMLSSVRPALTETARCPMPSPPQPPRTCRRRA